jgi:hypothetical protein
MFEYQMWPFCPKMRMVIHLKSGELLSCLFASKKCDYWFRFICIVKYRVAVFALLKRLPSRASSFLKIIKLIPHSRVSFL